MYYIIEKNNIEFIVENINNEPINIFFDRWYFILDFLNENPKYNFNEIVKLSFIFINLKYYGCKYPIQLYKKIEKYIY
jgi:hypothetical protein